MIEPALVDHYVIFGALAGAILWNVITWYYGLPSSSSHALIGGLAGAAVAKGGFAALVGKGFLTISLAIVLSPLLGFALGMLFMIVIAHMFFRTAPHRVDRWFRRLQFVSASLYSLGHGGNDAQKTMGIIAMLLFAAGMSGPTFNVPFWVVIACQVAMALGTLFGGWRIVKTMGMRITKLSPSGFCAETGGAITLLSPQARHSGVDDPYDHGRVSASGRCTSFRGGLGHAQRIVWAGPTIPARRSSRRSSAGRAALA